MDLVFPDGPTERPGQLLIRVRENALAASGRRNLATSPARVNAGNEVLRVEVVAPEISGERALGPVGARLRHGVHLDSARTALTGVESARDLQFRYGVAAEMGLAEGIEH